MRIDPIKHTAIKFPAPVCRDCSIPMITVTSIFRHATPDEEKIVSYECQKWRMHARSSPRPPRTPIFRLTIVGLHAPGVTPRHQHHPLIRRADQGFWK